MTPRFRHEVAGLILDSALELTEARDDASPEAACTFDVAAPRALPPATSSAWPAVERSGDVVTMRFGDMAAFDVHDDLSAIVCRPAAGVPATTLRHLLLDHVVPRVLELRGSLVLHASAVVTSAGAIGFLGASGAGKSTLATLLALSGWPLLSDDALVLDVRPEGLVARPTYPAFRLWAQDIPDVLGRSLRAPDPDGASGQPVAHYTEKRRFSVDDVGSAAFATAGAPLARAYVLEHSDGPVSIERLPARDAFLALWQCTFRLDARDPKRLRHDFSRLPDAALSSCRRLTYPRAYASFPAVRSAILADLAA